MPLCVTRSRSLRLPVAMQRSQVAESGTRMTCFQARAIAKQLFAQRAIGVFGLVDAAFLKLRHQQFDRVNEGFVGQRVRQVEPVDVCFFNPLLQQIGHGFRAADKQRAEATDADPPASACGVHIVFGSAVEKVSTAD